MCDDGIHQDMVFNDPRLSDISRRTLGLLAAGVVTTVATSAFAAVNVVEKDVMAKAGDGVADTALFYPEGNGKHPAILIWTDIMGLRPAFRDMARRLAAEGFVVLVPNVYYRTKPAPVIGTGFQFPRDRAQLPPAPDRDAATRDAVAFITYIDTLPQVDTKKKVGVQGHCMGGPFTFYTAAVRADRIAAANTFHGGGIGSAAPTSPHLLIPQTKAEFLCCVAQNDDKTDPEAKNRLDAGFDAVKRAHHVEVYHADHGWTVPDSSVYNKDEADRAYAAALAVYKRNLA
jgi:carboxymethylenebutenolidase